MKSLDKWAAIGAFVALNSGIAALLLASNGEVRPHDTEQAIFGAAMVIAVSIWRLRP